MENQIFIVNTPATVKFFLQDCQKMTVAGVFMINIWFSIPVPKIKFDPPPQGKNALVLIFYVFH